MTKARIFSITAASLFVAGISFSAQAMPHADDSDFIRSESDSNLIATIDAPFESPKYVVEGLHSDTFQPGFTASEEGGYIKDMLVEYQAPKTTIERIHSDVWQPGFTADDNGYYKDMVVEWSAPKTELQTIIR